MNYKVGETVRYFNSIKIAGVLQTITEWPIAAKARRDSATGEVLGEFVRGDVSQGVYELSLDTAGLPPCQVHVDVRVQLPSGELFFTDTDVFALLPAISTP